MSFIFLMICKSMSHGETIVPQLDSLELRRAKETDLQIQFKMQFTWNEVVATFDYTQNATTVSDTSWNGSMHWDVSKDGLVKNT